MCRWDTMDPELQSQLSATLEADPWAGLGRRQREAFEAARNLEGGLESMPGAAGRAAAAARKQREAKVKRQREERRDRLSNASAISGRDGDVASDSVRGVYDGS